MIVSKLTSKAQTTIPQSVRSALGISAGDEIAYAIEVGQVILTKTPKPAGASRDPWANPYTTFWEWSLAEDREDFGNL